MLDIRGAAQSAEQSCAAAEAWVQSGPKAAQRSASVLQEQLVPASAPQVALQPADAAVLQPEAAQLAAVAQPEA